MIKVFNGVEMFVRDSLFIRKCIRSIVIEKVCLVRFLSALKTGDEKRNITKQLKIQSSTPLPSKEHAKTGSSLEYLSENVNKNWPSKIEAQKLFSVCKFFQQNYS